MTTRADIITARNQLAPGKVVFRLGAHHVGVVMDAKEAGATALIVAVQPSNGEGYLFLQHAQDDNPTVAEGFDFAGLLAAEAQLRTFEAESKALLAARAKELADARKLVDDREAAIAAKTITITRELDPATNAYPGAEDLRALVKEAFPGKRFKIRADGESVKVTIFDDALEPVTIKAGERVALTEAVAEAKAGDAAK